MKQTTKARSRLLTLLLALALCLSLAAPALAADEAVALDDVTATEATTRKGEAKLRVRVTGVSGDVGAAQVTLRFDGALRYKDVQFIAGKDDPENGYTYAVTPRATANETKTITVGLLAVKTPLHFTGDDALFVVTFQGDAGQTVNVTVDAAYSYCMLGDAIHGTRTALPTASLSATASAKDNAAKSTAVVLTMDKVTDFADTDRTFLTLTLTDEQSDAVTTVALDSSYRDTTVSLPTYRVPLAVLADHSYAVELSGAGYAPYSKSGETFAAELSITNTAFLPGDVTGNGTVDEEDKTAFDELRSDNTYSLAADFNRDGRVDAHDAAYLPADSGSGSGSGSTGGGGG
ncbi:MAG: hypothetical protein K6G54_00010, partial [Oscillospiraceae bacterium]|nr:hypothetical protein [Oscillospiraceae bacterium]